MSLLVLFGYPSNSVATLFGVLTVMKTVKPRCSPIRWSQKKNVRGISPMLTVETVLCTKGGPHREIEQGYLVVNYPRIVFVGEPTLVISMG